MVYEKKIDCIRQARSPFKWMDILIYGLTLALIMLLLTTLMGKKGATVEVVSGGNKMVFSLYKNAERVIDGRLVLVIHDGECWVKCSTCDKKTCERTGKIMYVNQSIICAENRVVIRIVEPDPAGAGIIR